MPVWYDILLSFLQHNALFGSMFILFIEEAGFPISIADIVITYVGYQVSKGALSFPVAFISLLTADLVGVSILYYLSFHYGRRLISRFGKYMHLDETKLDRVEEKYKKYGVLFIIFGRHIPGLRIPTTVFAGISKITYPTFILSTLASIIWWIPFYLTLGERLGPRAVDFFQSHAKYSLVLILLPLMAIVVPLFLLRSTKKKE